MANHSVRHKTYTLLQSGASINEVARESGVSRSAVTRHARELGLIQDESLTPRYDWQSIQKEYDAGVSPSALMERHKFSSSAWTRAIQNGRIVPDPIRQRKRACKMNEDIVGSRFGHITVVKQVENANHCRRWLCKCDCGQEKIRTTGQLYHGIQSCGCAKRTKGSLNPRWTGFGEISGRYWGEIQHGAAIRSISFDLTIENAWALFESQNGRCAVSGIPISLYVNGRTASLDRIDSGGGYTINNVQWVHKDINFMKQDYKMEEFLAWVTRIYQHQQSLNHNEFDIAQDSRLSA